MSNLPVTDPGTWETIKLYVISAGGVLAAFIAGNAGKIGSAINWLAGHRQDQHKAEDERERAREDALIRERTQLSAEQIALFDRIRQDRDDSRNQLKTADIKNDESEKQIILVWQKFYDAYNRLKNQRHEGNAIIQKLIWDWERGKPVPEPENVPQLPPIPGIEDFGK